MQGYLDLPHFDLVTPDGCITNMERQSDGSLNVEVFIENISPAFKGFEIEQEKVLFNLKSTLAQVGVDARNPSFELNPRRCCAEIHLKLIGIDPLGKEMLDLLLPGAVIGKLFAADERRRVRDPDYLSRMFGRSDRFGRPLLSLGGLHGGRDLILDKVDGRTVAYLTLQTGRIFYEESIKGFLPTMAKALVSRNPIRDLVRLHQRFEPNRPRNVTEGELLLVRTLPLHIRTVFAKVVDDLIAPGFRHTAANVLEPNTRASGDIYELYGTSKRELTDIPLEFYTLEPYREHVFFSDRDQLQTCLEDSQALFNAFKTAPEPIENKAAVYVVKGKQLLNLQPDDWIIREQRMQEFPGFGQGSRQALMIQRYIEQQASFPFLKAISDGHITSQGILLSRYFPSPLMKRMLLSNLTQNYLKGIYFEKPSLTHGEFFSVEDRHFMHDLSKFAIPLYWVDEKAGKVLRYCKKNDNQSGMFVPLDKVETYLNSTVWGIYGSNLLEGNFEEELTILLNGVLELHKTAEHPLFHKDKSLSLITGGGPGAMLVGNRVAQNLGILSCANIVDFGTGDKVVNEQRQNPYIEAKMTYRLEQLVERQAEFHLDFPIFLMGGIGTDFEFTLEEVRRKVGSKEPSPILLFGSEDYWRDKISPRFQRNLSSGTIKGSSWVSNCFYCIQTAQQGLEVYREFFNGGLAIGPNGPTYEEGFCIKG